MVDFYGKWIGKHTSVMDGMGFVELRVRGEFPLKNLVRRDSYSESYIKIITRTGPQNVRPFLQSGSLRIKSRLYVYSVREQRAFFLPREPAVWKPFLKLHPSFWRFSVRQKVNSQ